MVPACVLSSGMLRASEIRNDFRESFELWENILSVTTIFVVLLLIGGKGRNRKSEIGAIGDTRRSRQSHRGQRRDGQESQESRANEGTGLCSGTSFGVGCLVVDRPPASSLQSSGFRRRPLAFARGFDFTQTGIDFVGGIALFGNQVREGFGSGAL